MKITGKLGFFGFATSCKGWNEEKVPCCFITQKSKLPVSFFWPRASPISSVSAHEVTSLAKQWGMLLRRPEEPWIWANLFTHCCPPFCRCPIADYLSACAVAVDACEEQSAAEVWQAAGGETVVGTCGRGLDSWGVFKQNRSLSKKAN